MRFLWKRSNDYEVYYHLNKLTRKNIVSDVIVKLKHAIVDEPLTFNLCSTKYIYLTKHERRHQYLARLAGAEHILIR